MVACMWSCEICKPDSLSVLIEAGADMSTCFTANEKVKGMSALRLAEVVRGKTGETLESEILYTDEEEELERRRDDYDKVLDMLYTIKDGSSVTPPNRRRRARRAR